MAGRRNNPKRRPKKKIELNVQSALDLKLPGEPKVFCGRDVGFPKRKVDRDALKVLRRLRNNKFQAFIVGGGVRDLLLGKFPKDYDIVTDARTDQIRALFRNSRIIGRRFKIVHLYFKNGKILEVATFRDNSKIIDEKNCEQCQPQREEESEVAMLWDDNVYGDVSTDAFRRDLTINALFYDAVGDKLIDYVNGIEDLKNGIIRVIGSPQMRYREDPIRILRVIRHAARTGFSIEKLTWSSIRDVADLIKDCPRSRVYEEIIREISEGYMSVSMELMFNSGVLSELFPILHEQFKRSIDQDSCPLKEVMRRIDKIISSGNSLSLTIIFASLCVGGLDRDLLEKNGVSESLLPYFIISPEIDSFSRENLEEISRSIYSVFTGLLFLHGIPRRLREEISYIIELRGRLYGLFQSEDEGALKECLKDKHFEGAFILTKLLANREVDENVCFFWYKLKKEYAYLRSPKKKNRIWRRRNNFHHLT